MGNKMRLLRVYAAVFFTIYVIQGCQPNNKASADLYSAIPNNSSLILEISDLQEAFGDFSNTRIYEEIRQPTGYYALYWPTPKPKGAL
ncbi:MAG: hypothetical protein U5L96_20620 [Owenweeksia sp.]|nr:hypothetical protein [Owenweeksia sp.]